MKKIAIVLFFPLLAFASDDPSQKPLQETLVEAPGKVQIDEKPLDYRIQAGTLLLKDEKGKDKALLSYTAYFLRDGAKDGQRPITFCFNGGPGAGSSWLNIGAFGPKRIPTDGIRFLPPPYNLVNNESSLLDLTDLVFIDPVSTGLSQAANDVDLKTLHSVDEDVQMMADFIRQFTVKVKRSESPKYIAGESYGGMRACKVAYKLQDTYGYYINGLILISPAIDLQTITFAEGNDLPYLLYLPTYAVIHHYHTKSTEDQNVLLSRVREFTLGRYSQALFLGDSLEEHHKKEIVDALSEFTGLSKKLILKNNLRVHPSRFAKAFKEDDDLILGRFDARITGLDPRENEQHAEYDPSLEAIFGAVTSSYNQLISKDLKWPDPRDYRALLSLSPWNWGQANSYQNALSDLRKLLAQNPSLKVLAISGWYDLAIPAEATLYSVNHLDISKQQRERIQLITIPGGHMMYFSGKDRAAIKNAIKDQFRL